ncbi:MAG TPA: hypothetical protein VFQ38_00135 [Longimicrobiales bacterium]|nr:hypothetical protein [Longimicrobiales bacterium]
MRGCRPRGAAPLAALLLLLARAGGAAGQGSGFVPDTGRVRATAPHWVGEFTILSANVLLSGASAGVVQLLRGGSFRDGFMRALPGGAAVYLGKRLAAERFDGAGLLGRQVAAVGTSVVRNAAAGAPMLDELILPVGLGRLYLSPRAPGRLRFRVDPVTLGWTVYGALSDDVSLDGGASLSAGAPVFKTHNQVIASGSAHAGGIVKAGVIFYGDVPAYGPVARARALAHEREHVLQEDFLVGAWIRPAQDWALPRLPGGAALSRFVDLDFSTYILQGMSELVREHDVRPWELEAEYLARRR